jgi:quinoprotein glucose dehydrogenase
MHHRTARFELALLIVAVLAVSIRPTVADEPYSPQIAPASNEAELAIPRIRVPEGFRVQLWAAEPLLANPVAFCIDERGRFFVAETFRQQKGVEDNRGHMDWLDDDLAAMTVEDRLAYFKKHLGDKISNYTKEQDRIRLLEDTNGDGTADRSVVFSDGYNGILEGTGAGVLARKDTLWYANIPNLWLLRDKDGDGTADAKESLHYGYGVRVAFRGHDSHGLCFGPDGKLYFSIGDRGFNVETKEGTRLVYPDQGAVLRCNPDGTELEVVHAGLRNPQELAFDDFGNLFTGDNNSDSGDKARWVQIVEGGDSGWRMSYQYLRDRGPWNREKLWHPQHDGQPAWVVPPIINIADGPSGLTYYPGVGLPDRYKGHFFLADFRGQHSNSGIRSFAVKPKGASFELVDSHEFAWSVLATDVDFGPDGAMYLTDWVEGWDGPGKGRIYKITHADSENAAVLAEVRMVLAAGFEQRSFDELAKLLAHPHRRVRQEAQFALAARGEKSIAAFSAVVQKSDNLLARLHALWGLGQIARRDSSAAVPVARLLADRDAEVRAQAARVIGDCRYQPAGAALAKLVMDESPRVRFFAAISVGKLGEAARGAPILEMIRVNNNQDPYLRHAGVMALARSPFQAEILAAANDTSPAVRLAVLLALRRQGSAEVARFLSDSDQLVVDEAARAINDVPIAAALPQLAALASRNYLTESTLYRVINANFRLGTAEHAAAVAKLAERIDAPEAIRVEAIRALGDWANPSGRDRVLGLWRPLAPRDERIAAEAFRSQMAGIVNGSRSVREAATQVAVKLGIKEIGPALFAQVEDKTQPGDSRIAALSALHALKDARTEEAVTIAIADSEPALRAEARRVLARLNPSEALPALSDAVANGAEIEQQLAFATLAEMKSTEADAVLAKSLDRLLAGSLPAASSRSR